MSDIRFQILIILAFISTGCATQGTSNVEFITELYSDNNIEIVYDNGSRAKLRHLSIAGNIFMKQVFIGTNVGHLEGALWHELGHDRHPRGMAKDIPLTRELAANAWVFEHYDGQNFLEIKRWMRKWLLSYINKGTDKAIDIPELRDVAVDLNIAHLITWKSPIK